jgi:hypothetical protein
MEDQKIFKCFICTFKMLLAEWSFQGPDTPQTPASNPCFGDSKSSTRFIVSRVLKSDKSLVRPL